MRISEGVRIVSYNDTIERIKNWMEKYNFLFYNL